MVIVGVLIIFGCVVLLVIFDFGVGLMDVVIVNVEGQIMVVYFVGVGNMVSLLIKIELGFEDFLLVEVIKKYLLVKVESLFSICYENGVVEFFWEVFSLVVFVKVVYIKEGELVLIDNVSLLEKICFVCWQVKEKVFVINCLCVLCQVLFGGFICDIVFVVLVGGLLLDFEILQFIMEVLLYYGVVVGQGNIWGIEGLCNVVVIGLLLVGQVN